MAKSEARMGIGLRVINIIFGRLIVFSFTLTVVVSLDTMGVDYECTR